MLEPFLDLPFSFIDAFKTSPSMLLEGLTDAPKALILELIRKREKKSLLVITGGERESRLFDDLLFFDPKGVYEYPSWEVLPGEEILPSPDIMGRRLDILHLLSKKHEPVIVLASVQSLLQKVVPKKSLSPLYHTLKKGEEILFDEVVFLLEELGYKRTKLVVDKGEFAVRGGIIDLFSASALTPYRIEFFGDTIEEIRTFDPMNQVSIEKVGSITLSPPDEYKLVRSYKDELVSLLDYIPDTVLVFDDIVKIEDRVVALENLPAAKNLLSFKDILSRPNQKMFWTKESLESLTQVETVAKDLRAPIKKIEMFGVTLETAHYHHTFQSLAHFFDAESLVEGVKDNPSFSCFFIGDGPKEIEALKEAFTERPEKSTFIEGYLSGGFAIRELKLLVLPYTEISHRLKVRRTSWRTSYHTPASDFHALVPGDLVVHFHSGIGRYLGIEKQKNHLGVESEFLIIEYAENSKLFVPVSQSHLISRYIGADEVGVPILHKLGSSQWQKMKTKAQTAIVGYAKDLLSLQAERELKGGFAFPREDSLSLEFGESFPYHETADQLLAIQDILDDMASPKAMDRLVCGDVGYGKTEVAMRAAFKAVAGGQKQVAVLVPTTILALQHFETFSARMSLFPIRIAVISRMQKGSEVKRILEKVASGEVDILIGTHRLISQDVVFKDLGLIIIDEEQRFGVRAKESLKKLKTSVDSLTLTATPIPRTLYFSLVGARNMSVINSPPGERLPIKTILAERDPEIIQNALLREFARDGQAYFIHNRVESIHEVKEFLQKLVPEARIGIVHGQMPADYVDDVFHAFKSGAINLLIATTIIENGVDIPNANTILIDRADTFGIADLYQMRGRVGRWNKTAYAYLLTPQNRSLPEIAQKRLNALAETSGYGGGMRLAMLDLEIRGAGDILGVQQSGHVASIGFHLYCKLLKKAVAALQKNTQASFIETKMEFSFDAKLSEAYVNDSSIRLEIYHRLGEVSSTQEIDTIFQELQDRFGRPPLCVLWLYYMTRIRLFANQNHFITLKFLNKSVVAERRVKEDTVKKSFFMPDPSSPELFEKALIIKLKSEFSL